MYKQQFETIPHNCRFIWTSVSDMLEQNAHFEGFHIVQLLSYMTSDNTAGLSNI